MLEKLLRNAMIEIAEENEVEVRIGRVTEEISTEWDEIKTAHQAEHDEIQEKIEAYITELSNAHSCGKFNDQKNDLWEKIYDEMGLSQAERGFNYRIDTTNRVVYRVDPASKENNQKTKSFLS